MSNGTSQSTVYTVEARTSYPQPEKYAGMLLGHNWRKIDFSEVPNGFGVPNFVFSSADRHGYLTYETAQAMRWWFHAARPLPACVETRLVAYRYKETWEAVEIGVSEAQKWPRRPFDDFTPRAASADTHPEGGDVEQAPFMGSAAPQEDAQ